MGVKPKFDTEALGRHKISEELPIPGRHRSSGAGRRQQLLSKEVVCENCGRTFLATGTRRYCYGGKCKKIKKRVRQSIVDDLAKEIKKGLYANFKIFQKMLPESGQTEINYDSALKMGFDEDAFYGTLRTKDNGIWYIVGEYYFLISHTGAKRLLHVYKK